MMPPVKTPKKLIEVALPLDAINEAAGREKSIRHGHPSTLHLWWARRPLAAARAVIFGQLVNDPSWKWEMEHPEEVPPNQLKASWAASRKRLFSIIQELVKWENTTNEAVLEKARAEIRKSWVEACELNKDHPQAMELFDSNNLPAFHDPFAGGGAIPLEAQRLGLEAYASDLNPVAVLINKAMIEIPPIFRGKPPVNPEARNKLAQTGSWVGAHGLAEDIRYYGQWMHTEAEKRIGHLYPQIEITADMGKQRPDLKALVGRKLTVIAWLWARTVKSPNPAFAHVEVPLVASFYLSTKKGKEAWVEPLIRRDKSGYDFVVRLGGAPTLDETVNKRGAVCLMSGAPMSFDHIRREAMAGQMGARLMTIVVEGNNKRVYLSPTPEMEAIARQARPIDPPDTDLPTKALGLRVQKYGMTKWRDLFTQRQLVALTTFSSLVQEARELAKQDALAAGMSDDDRGLSAGGLGAAAYADTLAVYLGLTSSKAARFTTTLSTWRPDETKLSRAFTRNDIAMTWDFAETNPFSGTGGDLSGLADGTASVLLGLPARPPGRAWSADACSSSTLPMRPIVGTDPPYYDNVPYADLSDYFYVWLRRCLRPLFPELFSTITVPKADELVADAIRHGGKENAERFFIDGMTRAVHNLAAEAHPAFPVTIYYAFKQSEAKADGRASAGWESFLGAVIRAGFAISGTWPVRTEGKTRMRSMGSNALASSIVLVCRPRSDSAATVSRRAFIRELNQVLPEAIDEMTRGTGDDRSPVAPVDLSQAVIGPGMAVFSKYAAVLEADGTPMNVTTALQLINRFLAEDDFDADTQFCLHWFEQQGWKDGKFGEADTLARAKGTSVDGVKQSGVLYAASGVVRLLKWADYPSEWDPRTDSRLPVWEVLHQLIRVFKTDGETGAGAVLGAVQSKAEAARQLAYRLYTLCERTGWAEDARAYNELITSWSAIESVAAQVARPQQANLFGA